VDHGRGTIEQPVEEGARLGADEALGAPERIVGRDARGAKVDTFTDNLGSTDRSIDAAARAWSSHSLRCVRS
jgi:hypothetical protein